MLGLFETLYSFIDYYHNEMNTMLATNKYIFVERIFGFVCVGTIYLKWHKEKGCLIVRDIVLDADVNDIMTTTIKQLLQNEVMKQYGLIKVRLDYIFNEDKLKILQGKGWTIVDTNAEMYK